MHRPVFITETQGCPISSRRVRRKEPIVEQPRSVAQTAQGVMVARRHDGRGDAQQSTEVSEQFRASAEGTAWSKTSPETTTRSTS